MLFGHESEERYVPRKSISIARQRINTSAKLPMVENAKRGLTMVNLFYNNSAHKL